MAEISYRRHRFPPVVIQHAVWLYCGSRSATATWRNSCRARARHLLRDGPNLGAKVRTSARRLRRRRPRPSDRWHLDEMVPIAGKRMYLWRVVDDEGEILDMLVQRRRGTRAALRMMRKLLKKQGFMPKSLVTDKLRSYASAFRRLRLTCPHEQGLRKNNRAENSHQWCDDESARCGGSNRLDRPSSSSAYMPSSTIPSISSAILPRDRRLGSSEPKPPTTGKSQSRRHRQLGVSFGVALAYRGG
jgi:putative transposase